MNETDRPDRTTVRTTQILYYYNTYNVGINFSYRKSQNFVA